MGHGDDALLLELALYVTAFEDSLGPRPALGAPRSVAGGAEGHLHGCRRADGHERVPAHVAGDEDRLADLLVTLWYVGMAGREGAGSPLSMDAEPHLFTVDLVVFDLGHVVAHVVDLLHAHRLPRAPEDLLEGLPCPLGDALAVRPGEVGRRLHGRQVCSSLG